MLSMMDSRSDRTRTLNLAAMGTSPHRLSINVEHATHMDAIKIHEEPFRYCSLIRRIKSLTVREGQPASPTLSISRRRVFPFVTVPRNLGLKTQLTKYGLIAEEEHFFKDPRYLLLRAESRDGRELVPRKSGESWTFSSNSKYACIDRTNKPSTSCWAPRQKVGKNDFTISWNESRQPKAFLHKPSTTLMY